VGAVAGAGAGAGAGAEAVPSTYICGPCKKVITYELARMCIFLGILYLWFIYRRGNPLILLWVEGVDING